MLFQAHIVKDLVNNSLTQITDRLTFAKAWQLPRDYQNEFLVDDGSCAA